MTNKILVDMAETAADLGACALIAPLGLETEFQALRRFEPSPGWSMSLVTEERTGQWAAILTPDRPDRRITLTQEFADRIGSRPGALDDRAFAPEDDALSRAAADLASEARAIAESAGGGHAGLLALVADAEARFDYGEVPIEQRWYFGRDAIPVVACATGNCIDINTYLIAGLRAAGYEAAYLTCHFIPEDPSALRAGMHCWVRTRCEGRIEDWDIAHFKKAKRAGVTATLNPIPGLRFALAYGRRHRYRWNDQTLLVASPSVPMWILPDGSIQWPRDYQVRMG